ncbi:hypothetical protein SETIT_4G130300v2 [Setaria italica]|uniref:Uncharacterized protein n=1 Tax=Setaria italica TaxID=4555 RepID=A0A368QTX9_SETIT|nr:hypothetical protein SETIT_4G130300v2 [Setaria italica]
MWAGPRKKEEASGESGPFTRDLVLLADGLGTCLLAARLVVIVSISRSRLQWQSRRQAWERRGQREAGVRQEEERDYSRRTCRR